MIQNKEGKGTSLVFVDKKTKEVYISIPEDAIDAMQGLPPHLYTEFDGMKCINIDFHDYCWASHDSKACERANKILKSLKAKSLTFLKSDTNEN